MIAFFFIAGNLGADEADIKAGLDGEVLAGEQPVAAAKVYAYELGTYALEKVSTDPHGRFLFQTLPAGLYKIVAFKEGFTPTVELLMRRRAEVKQTLQLFLTEEVLGDVRQAEDYWSARGRIPSDVLREIQRFEVEEKLTEAKHRGQQIDLTRNTDFQTQMVASSGVESLGEQHGDARLTNMKVGFRGAVGSMEVGVDGRFQQLALDHATAASAKVPEGEMRSLAFQVESAESSRLSVTTASGQSANIGPKGMTPVDLEHYQVRWDGSTGDKGRSSVSAHYTEESNYYQLGRIDPIAIPDTSRTFDLQGAYVRSLGRNTSLTTGLLYRQRSSDLAPSDIDQRFGENEEIGFFGSASMQIQPRIYVEYGLFSKIQDGGLSLMPHGGMVIQLGDSWQARTAISQRIDQGGQHSPFQGFSASQYDSDSQICQRSGEACYELTLTRHGARDNSTSLGAIHRKFAETLRVYFSDDFFDRLESLFMVQGDSLPELRFQMIRRITPKILAKLESNIASGGGGIFYATDEQTYENQVRYLVTSLDTLFQQTSTGVFVAFHHLEQDLKPMEPQGTSDGGSDVEMQRLQLMLTQDLNVLVDVSSKWAFRVNMELSRGSTPYTLTPDDELHKKLTGGFSVSF